MENQQLKQELSQHKLKSNESSKQLHQQQQSEWSLSSLEQIKDIKSCCIQQHAQQQIEVSKQQSYGSHMLEIKSLLPKKQVLTENTILHYVGIIIEQIDDVLVVKSEVEQVVNLDTWLCDKNYEYIGFVVDVIGKIQAPYYALKIQSKIQNWRGLKLFYVQGSRIINTLQLKQMKMDKLQEGECSNSDEQIRYMSEQKQKSCKKKQQYNRKEVADRSRTRDYRKQKGINNEQRSKQMDQINHEQINHNYLSSLYQHHYQQMMHFYQSPIIPNQRQIDWNYYNQSNNNYNNSRNNYHNNSMNNQNYPQMPYYPNNVIFLNPNNDMNPNINNNEVNNNNNSLNQNNVNSKEYQEKQRFKK